MPTFTLTEKHVIEFVKPLPPVGKQSLHSKSRFIVAFCFSLLLIAVGLSTLVSSSPVTARSKASTLQQYRDDLIAFCNDVQYSRVKFHRTGLMTRFKRMPARHRSVVLSTLLSETKWGTKERAAVSFAAAWYGVKYTRCSEYLVTAFFWGHPGGPCGLGEYSVRLLMSLYKRHRDPHLLYRILTGRSDGAGSVELDIATGEAFEKYRRGVLQVASMSRKGYETVVADLTVPDGEPTRISDEAESLFRTYLKRVVAKPDDPLRKTAKRLLRDTRRHR